LTLPDGSRPIDFATDFLNKDLFYVCSINSNTIWQFSYILRNVTNITLQGLQGGCLSIESGSFAPGNFVKKLNLDNNYIYAVDGAGFVRRWMTNAYDSPNTYR
jgi:hypothetical protein